MIRKVLKFAALAAAVGLGACDKQLVVGNPNSGETQRVIGTPGDAEALISSYYKRWYTGVYSSTTDLEGMANIFGMMNYSSLANNCQNSHAPFTNASNGNSPGNVCAGEQSRIYFVLGEVNRVAANLLTEMDKTDGKLDFGTVARNARARAFAEFLRGISIGYIALVHDSVAVVSSGQKGDDPGKLVSYSVAMDSAYAALQRAIDAASPATSTSDDGFPIPTTWIPSVNPTSSAEFVRLVRSYRARLRANVARTAAERAAANWSLIIADAQNGFTADHQIVTTSTFSTMSWRKQYESFGLWHQMPPFIIGMADVSGSYAAWLAQPLGDRGSGNNGFFMVTPDLRWPQGGNRAAQQADFAASSCAGVAQTCKRYFVNRIAGNDQFAGLAFGSSNYDFVRFHSWVTKGDAGSGGQGPVTVFAKAELDLLAAEGFIRTGQYASAAPLINATRTANGLPAITVFDGTTPVPGTSGNTGSCVPKVPMGAGNALICGNMMEAMKWEKRMETAYVAYMPWFLDNRGWGDLAQDTPLFWAVPYQDLQARGTAISALYGAGVGAGNAAASSQTTKSAYGW
ncbi:MAG: hypothetical protein ABI885_25990 [Gammaproteobacteria bacterium]